MNWEALAEQILPADTSAIQAAAKRQDSLIKPMGSLGRLEDLAIQLSGITGKVQNDLTKKAILVFCADNGVYEEGVSAAQQEVTAVQAVNMLEGKTGVAVLAKQGSIDLKVIDIGIKSDVLHPKLIHKKIAYGTKNAAKEPAMTKEECSRAMETGYDLVKEMVADGYQILGLGEMGISNTTTSESVIMALSGATIQQAAGLGAGLTPAQFQQKKEVLRRMQSLHAKYFNDPISIIRTVGGFDIAAMLGCFLAAAECRIPIVIDGVVTIAAALAAYCLNPNTKAYMLPSHASAEPAYAIAAKKMCLRPYFDLDMRLGEGSGCPFTMYLAEAATRIMRDMTTFSEGKVDQSYYVDIRKEQP